MTVMMKNCRRVVVRLFMCFVVGATVVALKDQRAPHKPQSLTLHPSPSTLHPPTPDASAFLAKLPLSFVENQGQWDTAIRFQARKGNLTAWVEPHAISLQGSSHAVRLAFEGASERAQVVGEEPQAGRFNYFLGNDPAKWQTGIPSYSRIVYRHLYEGIDLKVREHEGQLEYDLCLAPGADLRPVVIRTEGVERLEVADDGSLLMHTALGPIRQHAPTTWYELPSGERQAVTATFRLLDATRYTFEVPHRNMQLALVIDPGLVYSSYLGGNQGDVGSGIAIDGAGNGYVTGTTTSTNFPIAGTAYQSTNIAGNKVFVTKINPQGSSLIYSTYLGGNGGEYGLGIAIDTAGNAYVTGQTYSGNFPTTPGAYDTSYNGYGDAFVTKLNPQGSALIYSTYLGGSLGYDEAVSIAIDAGGNAYVTGYTVSSSFPTTPGVYDPTYNGGSCSQPFGGTYPCPDAFVAKLNPSASGPASLIYSTYLGGGSEDKGKDIAVDTLGNAYVIGHTSSINFPTTPSAYDNTLNGSWNAFVTKLNVQGSGLLYSTYLGSNDALGFGIAVDASGNAYVTGRTGQVFPTTPGAYDTSYNSGIDAFVTKLDPSQSGAASMIYSTFLGGGFYEAGNSIAVDTAGNAYVTGLTSSPNFPTTLGAFQTTCTPVFLNGECDYDAFIAKFNATGAALLYSTRLGGNGLANQDYGLGLVVDIFGSTYVAGQTQSTNFPTTPGAFQTTPGGVGAIVYDAFATKLDLLPTGVVPYGSASSGGTGLCPASITLGVTRVHKQARRSLLSR